MQKLVLGFLIVGQLLTIGCSQRQEKNNAINQNSSNQGDSGTIKKERRVGELTLSHIIAFAYAGVSANAPCQEEQTVPGFDFKKLAVTGVALDTFSTRICQDGSNRINSIVQSSKYNTRNFNVLRNDDDGYTVMHADVKLSKGETFAIGGFLLEYQEQWYFLKPKGHPTYIMRLDSNLNVVQTIRTLKFADDRFYYKTRINYRDDGELYSETFFSLKDTVEINEQTKLVDVLRLLNSEPTGKGEMELRLGLPGGFDRLPFWAIDSPEYDYQAIKNKKILELSFKEHISK